MLTGVPDTSSQKHDALIWGVPCVLNWAEASFLLLSSTHCQVPTSGIFSDICWAIACLRTVQEVVAAEVAKRAEQVRCVLCLGHNKGMEEAATSLAVRAQPISTLPPCCLGKSIFFV